MKLQNYLRILVFFLLGMTLSNSQSFAQSSSSIYVQVGKANVRKTVLAMAPFKVNKASDKSIADRLYSVIQSDMAFSGYFKMLNKDAIIDKNGGEKAGTFPWSAWSTLGTEILVKGRVEQKGGSLHLYLYLHNVSQSKGVFEKHYQSSARDYRALAHRASNAIVESLTGIKGIFDTHMAFICDGTGKKELYVADYDGANPIQLTKLKSLVIGPAWTPDGDTIIFSVFRKHKGNVKNIDLMSYNIRSGKLSLLSNQKGINSGAAVSPDGRQIALTMSFLGNSEIFSIDRRSKRATQITKNGFNDVDPSWSPDGNTIAFVSDRPGKPMIYTVPVDRSSKPKRITFAGRYNATPNFSPDGKYIVFSSWVSGLFDLFLVTPDGKNLERLTKNQGSNEDPNFSPNGQYIAFSSKRYAGGAQRNFIYATNVSGTVEKQITYTNLGNCTQPRWSTK